MGILLCWYFFDLLFRRALIIFLAGVLMLIVSRRLYRNRFSQLYFPETVPIVGGGDVRSQKDKGDRKLDVRKLSVVFMFLGEIAIFFFVFWNLVVVPVDLGWVKMAVER